MHQERGKKNAFINCARIYLVLSTSKWLLTKMSAESNNPKITVNVEGIWRKISYIYAYKYIWLVPYKLITFRFTGRYKPVKYRMKRIMTDKNVEKV